MQSLSRHYKQYGNLAFLAALILTMAALSSQASDMGPGAPTREIAAGAALYEDFCARCHGVEMREPESAYFDLRTFPADQRSRFMNSVANGKNSMPPWRSVLSSEEIASLFDYVISGGEKN